MQNGQNAITNLSQKEITHCVVALGELIDNGCTTGDGVDYIALQQTLNKLEALKANHDHIDIINELKG